MLMIKCVKHEDLRNGIGMALVDDVKSKTIAHAQSSHIFENSC